MNVRPLSSFSPWLRWINDEHGQLAKCLPVWMLLRVVSVRHSGPLPEPAAVFLISPCLADFAHWCFWTLLTPKSEGTFSELTWERERLGEKKSRVSCLVFVQTTYWSWLIESESLTDSRTEVQDSSSWNLMATSGAGFFSLSSGLQFMLEKQNFPLNIFFKWSTNISLLDTVEAMCMRVAHACLYWADFSPTLKGVKGYSPGSVMRMSRRRALSWRQNWSSGVAVRQGASPHPRESTCWTGCDQFHNKRQEHCTWTDGVPNKSSCVSWTPEVTLADRLMSSKAFAVLFHSG